MPNDPLKLDYAPRIHEPRPPSPWVSHAGIIVCIVIWLIVLVLVLDAWRMGW